jgi:glyoxylase-like metal-dependent hydrolase (beta-lactamase superfamily II)
MVSHDHPAPSGRVPKEEQEPASTEVTEVAEGILRLQLPSDFTGLGHVNCYAIEDERGFTLVDPGLPTEASWDALKVRLADAGIPLERVHTTFITHSHPDHFGGAHRLVEEVHPEVLTSTAFRTWSSIFDLDETPLEPIDPADAAESVTFLDIVAGMGDEELARRFPDFKTYRDRIREAVQRGNFDEVVWVKAPRPTITVDDLEVVRMGGRDWVALWTPGHTYDHLCLWSPVDGVILTGDHVLPTITPHISGVLGGDSLASYLENLEKVGALDGVTRVLPAHGHPFDDLASRCRAIQEHHAHRLQQLLDAGPEVGGWAPVPRWSEFLFAPRSRGPMADSETVAHLDHLRRAGTVERRRTEAGDEYRVVA